ncbi:PAS domain-containing protein [Streptomyces sp. NPDC092952]|uniref:PAS domain-containing protein n=1 Tax=Streptomyces sp. NPDC092952 TaxID=3366018 RepID=UPI0037F1E6F9
MNNRPSRGADHLAAIVDALPDGLVIVNGNGTIVNANTMALGMFEMPGAVLVGRGLFDLLPGFDPRSLPGPAPLPEDTDGPFRTAPERMTARRADGSEFAAEVTGVHLDGRGGSRGPYEHAGERLLLLVLRDLTRTFDTEGELNRSHEQLEMVLRAASEGVVGTDIEGRVVLVNPAAARLLGYRAGQLGGQDLHSLILHSRTDGESYPYEESPLADTLRSGRAHRVREQVLWTRDGTRVPVDIATAPVREGSRLVGAVLTFTDQRPYERLVQEHEAELAGLAERHGAELDRHRDRLAALTARNTQLAAALDGALHGTLAELTAELRTLAADDAVHLWPEAHRLLDHLVSGYTRAAALIDDVLDHQRSDAGADGPRRSRVLLDRVVDAGIDRAVELAGPGRLRFQVDTPPVEADVDPERLATALAHLIADVAGIGAPDAGHHDPLVAITVGPAPRGDAVRVEVRGPHTGGDPVHQALVHGIVGAHGGTVRTRGVPETGGGVHVMDIPFLPTGPAPEAPSPAHREDAGPVRPAAEVAVIGGTGRRHARRAALEPVPDSARTPVRTGPGATGRRRGRPAEGVVATAAESTRGNGPDGEAARPRRARGAAPATQTGTRTGGPDGSVVPAARPFPGGRHASMAGQEWGEPVGAEPWGRSELTPAGVEGAPGLVPAPVYWPEPAAETPAGYEANQDRPVLPGPHGTPSPEEPPALAAPMAAVRGRAAHAALIGAGAVSVQPSQLVTVPAPHQSTA